MRRYGTIFMAVCVLLGAVVGSALVWRRSGAAFSAVAGNGGNAWQAGQVQLTAGSASALFSLGSAGLKPNDTGSRCITITYAGNVAATVKFSESAQSGTLAPYVLMTVTRADGTGAVDCSNFAGLANPAVVTTSTDLVSLATAAGGYATGLGGWTATTTTTKTYKFTYVVSTVAPNSVQNATAAATFTWEVQSN